MAVTSGALAIEQELSYPLVVVGGGLAGVCAAIAAARQGVRVALVQERSVLGGNSSSEVRVHPVGASQSGYNRDARETGLMEELFLDVRARSYGLRQINGQHYPMWDVILGEKAEAEPNLTLYLNTRVVGVETADETRDGYTTRVTALLAAQQGTEHTYRFRCDYVIDATGDGFIALQSGAPFRYGREARAEFGESWAPEEADDLVLGSTIMFAARDVGRPVPFVPPAWAHVFPDEDALPFRNHDEFTSGYWWIEWGGKINTITDNEAIRRELHAAVFGVWDHIKNRCTAPGIRERAATWTMDWIGHLPGKRESRRFEGDHILTEGDVLRGLAAVPDDVIAYGGWPIDLHAPDGIYSPDRPCTQPPLPGLYGIPLRSLYSRTVANLFLAGRDLSATHVAHGSTRVMKTCAAIGQASGTAAALAAQCGLTPRALAGDCAAVRAVQQTLLRAGAYLPLRRNEDERDLARRPGVTVTATSEAALCLDDDDTANPSGWELAGLSFPEHYNPLAGQRPGGPAAIPLTVPVAQSFAVSAGQLDAVTLRLCSGAAGPVTARLHLRQAAQLRDFGPCAGAGEALATLEATVPPGDTAVTFQAAPPVTTMPGQPVVLLLEPLPDVAWRLSAQEPPGTQAGRWDEELGYWRWLHGTLHADLTPVSRPYAATNVLSGVTRPEVGANMWIADPAAPLPQALELAWPAPVTLGRVELTFDSQLSGWVWEGAFPLVAREYRVEAAGADGAWATLAEVSGNWQRRRVHTCAPRAISRLRITILATNGGRTARLVEVRAYAE
ncbi:MAG: FAD-dependent oxidoreductase [Thermomicrobiales bacterium]